MDIVCLPVGQLQANCYLVVEKLTRRALIIDPGDDAELIVQKILEKTLKPKAIIATHGHFDHVMAVLELKLAFGLPFYLHQEDEFLLKKLQSSAKHWLGTDPGPPPKVDRYLSSKQPFQFGKRKFQVIDVPGHTPGGTALYCQEEKVVFAGDTVFAGGGVGRTDFAYSSSQDLNRSVRKILALPEMTLVYPGHGAAATVGEIKSQLGQLE